MCLIIHRPLGPGHPPANLPQSIIEHNERSNPDGFGIAWRDRNGLHHLKYAPSDFERFEQVLKAVDSHEVEYVAHFRRATHGAPCEELSHPFHYTDADGKDVLVFHNGIIPIPTAKGESDTEVYVRKVLSKLPPRWWAEPGLAWLVEETMGYSRLLIMSGDETVRLGKGWQDRDGIWFSTFPGPGYYYNASLWKGKDDDDDTEGSYYGKGELLGGVKPVNKKHSKGGGDRVTAGEKEVPGAIAGGGFRVSTIRPVSEAAEGRDGWFTADGHYVAPLDGTADTDDQGDSAGQAECQDCGTFGEWYRIGGRLYLDVPHEPEEVEALEAQAP